MFTEGIFVSFLVMIQYLALLVDAQILHVHNREELWAVAFQVYLDVYKRQIEARINYLAYAPEIAAVMLRRQQADAVIMAREKIVEGAVSMVKMAVDRLSSDQVVHLDDDKKAAMVSNLMVVLCSDDTVHPVVNTGN